MILFLIWQQVRTTLEKTTANVSVRLVKIMVLTAGLAERQMSRRHLSPSRLLKRKVEAVVVLTLCVDAEDEIQLYHPETNP